MGSGKKGIRITSCGCNIEVTRGISVTCLHGREFLYWGIPESDKTLCHEITKTPKVVCLCGPTRFSEAFYEANLKETLAGKIVLTIGCDMRSDSEIFSDKSEEELATIKRALDILHFRKIELADEVLILNPDGYIGESTRRELEYALSRGKTVRFLVGGYL